MRLAHCSHSILQKNLKGWPQVGPVLSYTAAFFLIGCFPRNQAMQCLVEKTKKGSAPMEVIVQRLASEADSKQMYRPVQPREFVEFLYEDLSLTNLKKACAVHFNLPVSTCDILVSNKGPSYRARTYHRSLIEKARYLFYAFSSICCRFVNECVGNCLYF